MQSSLATASPTLAALRRAGPSLTGSLLCCHHLEQMRRVRAATSSEPAPLLAVRCSPADCGGASMMRGARWTRATETGWRGASTWVFLWGFTSLQSQRMC
eukprot:3112478-Pyramimonas_sp.AAC.1